MSWKSLISVQSINKTEFMKFLLYWKTNEHRIKSKIQLGEKWGDTLSENIESYSEEYYVRL